MSDPAGRCGICADEAVPAVVRSVRPADDTAEVEMCSELRRVALDLIGPASVGDTILVHQGFAIARLEAR